MPSQITSHSLRLLLLTSIDYAGLFPPKSLNLKGAITTYKHHCAGKHHWMLGRFVVSLEHLSSLSRYLNRYLDRSPAPLLWPLSVVIEPSIQALKELGRWLRKQNPFAIAALEFKLTSPEVINALLPHIPPNIDLFFELPSTQNPDHPPLSAYLDVLQGTQAAAKVQTGGLTPAHIPSVDALAHFISTCAKAKVPFKATAGLQHPLRSIHTLPNGDLAQMHGFLNVALAATVAYGYDASLNDIAAILRIASAQSIGFAHQAIVYQLPPRVASH
ncbi:MAG: hypothetical protein F6K16_35010, partial [Symploca sp. SIO2B6]|nr:hypothetical protein [Symploca sp. SIO2B6]